jgi:hypothetical protein
MENNMENTVESTVENTNGMAAAPIAQEIPEKLTQQQALQVLVDAARVAQSKGIFSLEDAELVSKAIKAFVISSPEGPSPSNG